MTHPAPADLALLASGDLSFPRGLLLRRHVRNCPECAAEIETYAALRNETANAMPADLDWDRLATEMRANIRLGLEAGQCVGSAPALPAKSWNPRLAIALASLVALIGCGIFLTREPHHREIQNSAATVVRSTAEGVEVRSGSNSLELLNRNASIAHQSAGAQGEVGVRYVDETGAITINNVYLQ